MGHPAKFAMVQADCRAFANVLDSLLIRRRHELHDQTRPRMTWQEEFGSRRWTQGECDLIYTSYPDLRKGKIAHPPTRDKVMYLANYLECTLEERNRLLLAANHLPVMDYMTDEALTSVLPTAHAIIDYLPFPSYIINRDWSILTINAHMSTLFDISYEEFHRIDPRQRTILHFIFDPRLPIHHRLRMSKATWEQIARRNIYGFKTDNLLCQNDAWYHDHVAHIRQVPLIDSYWDLVDIDTYPVSDGVGDMNALMYLTDIMVRDGVYARIRSLLILLGNFQYPQIVSYIPADTVSTAIFATLGIPTPETAWNKR